MRLLSIIFYPFLAIFRGEYAKRRMPILAEEIRLTARAAIENMKGDS